MSERFENLPETSVPIEPEVLPHITTWIVSGVGEFNEKVSQEGLAKLFQRTYHHLPASLRHTIRSMVNTYYPGYRDTFVMKPDAKAIEYGLVMGLQLAQTTLEPWQFDEHFVSFVDKNCRMMTIAKEKRAKDLADTVREHGGNRFMYDFGSYFSPVALSYDTEASVEANYHNSLYQSALGYYGALMQSYIEAYYINSAQPTDADIREEISMDAEALEWIFEEDVYRFF